MKITKQTLASRVRPSSELKNRGTDSKYIRINNGKSYLEFGSVSNLLKTLPTPMIDGQSGVQRWLKDRSKGLNRISKIIDYSQAMTDEKIEKFIYASISIYLFGEEGKFPVKDNKDGETPEPSENPDDMSSINKGLDEIGININDFEL